jgi:hypothetical protein
MLGGGNIFVEESVGGWGFEGADKASVVKFPYSLPKHGCMVSEKYEFHLF